MGIRFYCPNGHKLHVKEFQAGHRGICPYCGVSVDIPLTSTRGSSKGQPSTGHKQSTGADAINLNEIAPSSAPDEASGASFTATRQDKEIELSAPLNRQVTVPTAPTSVPARPADPFTEAPSAVWYVKPVAGGQYGPASADIMKSWLEEGRIASDSMVWREGWTDWRIASDVFEQLTPHRIDFHLDLTPKNKTPEKKSPEKKAETVVPTRPQPVELMNPNTTPSVPAIPDIPTTTTNSGTPWYTDIKTIVIIVQGIVIVGLIIWIILGNCFSNE